MKIKPEREASVMVSHKEDGYSYYDVEVKTVATASIEYPDIDFIVLNELRDTLQRISVFGEDDSFGSSKISFRDALTVVVNYYESIVYDD
jgi:hypothetical protein